MTESAFPASLGYRMPAQWEPHSGTWLAWPHNLETWFEPDLAAVENLYVEIIRALADGETVHLLVNDEATREAVLLRLRQENILSDHVRLYVIPTDDAWIRDYGPNFLVATGPPGKRTALNKWLFDSWGGKYDWEKDNRAGMEIALRARKVQQFEPGIVLEGGAIEVNGAGTCLTTESCLLNKNRNGGLSRKEMENYLKRYLGVRKIVWLNGDLEGDDTDGHIDNLARFVNPTTLLCAWEDDPADKNYKGLKENYEKLLSVTDQDGNLFNTLRLPMPGTVLGDGSTRLPASYANFYIANRTVLVPLYGHANDAKALALLQRFFPDRRVTGLDCNILVKGLGGIHCITQQQPAGSP